MAKMTYDQGEQHMLATYFQNKPEAFGPFWVGLGTGPAPLKESSTLTNMAEIAGDGYTRQEVARDDSPAGWLLEGNTVQSPVLTFTNQSVSVPWEMDFVFLTLTSGVGGSSVLIAAVDLPDTVLVLPGSTVEVVFRFKTTTILSGSDRFLQMAGIASGTASMSATVTVI